MRNNRNPARLKTDYPFALFYNMRRPIRILERAVNSKIRGGEEGESGAENTIRQGEPSIVPSVVITMRGISANDRTMARGRSSLVGERHSPI